MTITADSREKEKAILEGCDERKLLSYPNPADPSKPFSYDLEVTTRGGQTLRGERKSAWDAVGSFTDGKLDRQCAAVDFLIVEWDELTVNMTARGPDSLKAAKNCRRHIQRLSLAMPVIIVANAAETIETLRYFESHEKPLDLFENRVKTTEGDTMTRILASLPGINPWRPMGEGVVLKDVLLTAIDRKELLAALAVAEWPSLDYAGGRRIGPKTAENVAQSILDGEE